MNVYTLTHQMKCHHFEKSVGWKLNPQSTFYNPVTCHLTSTHT